MYIKVLFLALLIASSPALIAQPKLGPQHFILNECNLAFKHPVDYSEIETESRIFLPKKNFGGIGILDYIINNDNDIMIGVSAVPFLPADERELRLRVALSNSVNRNDLATIESVHPNNNWRNTIEAFIDSTKIADFKFDHLMSLNADTVVVFPVEMENVHKGKYNKCKFVIMHKDDIGIGQLLYFYHDQNEHLVDAEIRKTWGMLVFRPDSMDNPAWRKRIGAD